MLQSTLTDRWQTTIPAEIRKALDLKPRQRLTYELREDGVLIKAQPETLKDLYGFLSDEGKPARSKKEERDQARAARAARYE